MRGYEALKFSLATAATAAGTTDIESAIYDLMDYEGICFFTTALAITTGAVTSIKVQVGDASDLSDAADVTGLAITIADDDDNQSFLLDYKKSGKRYCRCVVDRGTQNAAFGEIYAVLYGAHTRPVTNAVANTATEDHA